MKRLEGSDRRAIGLVALWVAGAGLVGGPFVANRIEHSLEDRVASHSDVRDAEAAGATVSVNGRTAHIEPGPFAEEELAILVDKIGDIDGVRSVKLDRDSDTNPQAASDSDPEVASITQVPGSGSDGSTSDGDTGNGETSDGDTGNGDSGQTNSEGVGVDGETSTSVVNTSLIAAPTITQPPETDQSSPDVTASPSTTRSSTTASPRTDTDSSNGSGSSDGSTTSDGEGASGGVGDGLADGRPLTDAEQQDLQVAAGELERLLGDQNIEFVFSTAIPTEATQDLLVELIELMENNELLELHIVGHTDGIGNAAANQQLSLDRAQSIANHLIIGGIDSARMTVEGRGSSDPVAENETGAGNQHNRRVAIEAKGLKS